MNRLFKTKHISYRPIIAGIVATILLCSAAYWYFVARTDTNKAPSQAALQVTIGEKTDTPRVVVYTDPLCATCKQYHKETLTRLAQDAKDDKLQLEIRPVAIISERSARLTEALMCANDQGAYMQSADLVYEKVYRDNGKSSEINAGNFTKELLPNELAKQLSIDETKFVNCMQERTYDERIAKADKQAYEGDVYSTPTTFIDGVEPIRGFAQYDYIKGLAGYL